MPPAKKAAPVAKKAAATAKGAPANAAPQATVTLKHLAAALSDSHDLPKKQADAVLGDLVTLTTRHLKRGGKIRLNGLGILQVRKRAARMGRIDRQVNTFRVLRGTPDLDGDQASTGSTLTPRCATLRSPVALLSQAGGRR